MGKTSFVLNIAVHCALKPGSAGGVFSLEMSKEQLALRMLSSEARVDAHRFRGDLLGADFARPGRVRRLLEATVFIDDTPGRHPRDARQGPAAEARARPRPDHRRLPAAHAGWRTMRDPPAGALADLAVAQDHWPRSWKCRSSRSPSSRARWRPAGISGRCSRTSASRAHSSRTPTSSSSSSARHVPARRRGNPEQGVAELIIGKQRNGPIGTCRLAFLKQYTRFENLAAGGGYERLGSAGEPAHGRHGQTSTPFSTTSRRSARLLARANRTRTRNPGTRNPGTARDARHRRRQSQRLRAWRDDRRAGARSGGRVDARLRRHRGGRSRCARPASTGPILVFGALSVSDLDGVFTHRLTPTVSTPGAARALERAAAARAACGSAVISRSTPA